MHPTYLRRKVGKSSSLVIVVKAWSRLLKAVVESPSLKVLKSCVDVVLWNMV